MVVLTAVSLFSLHAPVHCRIPHLEATDDVPATTFSMSMDGTFGVCLGGKSRFAEKQG
jgi:hypothetical protein